MRRARALAQAAACGTAQSPVACSLHVPERWACCWYATANSGQQPAASSQQPSQEEARAGSSAEPPEAATCSSSALDCARAPGWLKGPVGRRVARALGEEEWVAAGGCWKNTATGERVFHGHEPPRTRVFVRQGAACVHGVPVGSRHWRECALLMHVPCSMAHAARVHASCRRDGAAAHTQARHMDTRGGQGERAGVLVEQTDRCGCGRAGRLAMVERMP